MIICKQMGMLFVTQMLNYCLQDTFYFLFGSKNFLNGYSCFVFTASYVSIKPNLQLKDHQYQSATKMLNIKANKCHICSETTYFHCYECVQVRFYFGNCFWGCFEDGI